VPCLRSILLNLERKKCLKIRRCLEIKQVDFFVLKGYSPFVDSLYSLNKKNVPYSLIRVAYVLYEYSPSVIAEEFKVNEEEVSNLIKAQKWEAERKTFWEKIDRKVIRNEPELTERYVNVYLDRVKAMIDFHQSELRQYQAHREFFGDLYLRDIKTGEILYDIVGKPMLYKLTELPKKLDLKTIQEVKELSKQGLAKTSNPAERDENPVDDSEPPSFK
jgi:hypothetical protein